MYNDLVRAGARQIVDVGGSPIRHQKEGRMVHSCCPELLPSDTMRNHLFRDFGNYTTSTWCEHTVQSCDCKEEIDAYMFVHSLYYFSAYELLGLLLKTKLKTLSAVIHQFPNMNGTLFTYGNTTEAKYQVDGELVEMKVVGNSFVYKHKNLYYLRASYYQDCRGAMAWSMRQMGDSFIVTFKQAKRGLGKESTQMTLYRSVTDDNYYDDAEQELQGDLYDLPNFTYRSVGKLCWMTSQNNKTPIKVSKKVILQVALKISGRERTPDLYKEAVSHARKLLRDTDGLDPLTKARGLSLTAALAFVLTLQEDLASLNAVVRPQHSKIGWLNEALSWTWRMHLWGGIGGWKRPWSLWKMIVTFGRQLITFVDPRSYFNNNNGSTSFISAKFGRALSYKGLPWFGVNLYMPLQPLRKGALIRARKEDSPTLYRVDTNTPKMFQIAPHIATKIPVVPESSVAHEILAVTNRACVVVPEESIREWQNVQNLIPSLLFPEEIVPLKYEEWNSNFPKGRQRQHDRAKEQLMYEGLKEKDFLRQSFIKVEKYNKGGEEVENFDPRLIQGTSHKANVALGPWMAAFNAELKKQWGSFNHIQFRNGIEVENSIYYASGATAEDLGKWFDKAINHFDEVIYIENDFSRFDGTQQKGCFNLERQVYELFDLAAYPEAHKTFLAQKKKVGYTKNSVYYKVKYTRASGDPNTSCGNSLINGLAHAYVFEQLSIPRESYRMTILGDDCLIIMDKMYEQLVDAKRITELFKKLGFNSKTKVKTEPWEVEFCSGIFWPVADEDIRYVLGCKPGKLLAKVAFSCKNLRDRDVRGCFVGHWINNAHVPLVWKYIDIVLKKLKTSKKEQIAIFDKFKINASKSHKMDSLARLWFRERYQLDSLVLEKRLQESLSRCSITGHVVQDYMTWLEEIDN